MAGELRRAGRTAVRSLNPDGGEDAFHARLAELSGAGPGETLLDLGCGRGATLARLIERVGPGGAVLAFDRREDWLGAAVAPRPGDAGRGRLLPVRGDAGGPLPLRDGALDAVVCQDVVECVRDRPGLVGEVRRVLRPGGRALLGHHDFDGVILASDDRGLTRRLVHGFADHVQAWQDASEGQMGRLLPGLVAAAGFAAAETEAVLLVDLEPAPGSYARSYLGWLAATAAAVGVGADEARRWFDGLRERAAAGTFYFAVPWVYVLARR